MPRKPSIIVELSAAEKKAITKAARKAKVTVSEFVLSRVLPGLTVDTTCGMSNYQSHKLEINIPSNVGVGHTREVAEPDPVVALDKFSVQEIKTAVTNDRPDPGHFENGLWVAD